MIASIENIQAYRSSYSLKASVIICLPSAQGRNDLVQSPIVGLHPGTWVNGINMVRDSKFDEMHISSNMKGN